ncbi:MAG: hypothetical protein ACLPXM_13245 [Terriglobales bacterium]
MDEFRLTSEQERWALKRRQGISPSELRKALIEQGGLCRFSQAPLLFEVSECTPMKGGRGCHPLCPAVDHKDPGNPEGGFQIVCYALNDLKGHLPVECFDALSASDAWKALMLKWREQAEKEPRNRDALMRLLRPNAKLKKPRVRGTSAAGD